MSGKSVIIIGSGFAGLSAAAFMARQGWQVTVLEKNAGPGGRAAQLNENGFKFDMGPSFYWMPDVFDRWFAAFGKKTSDYYSLKRLDPSYRVYWDQGFSDISAEFEKLSSLFESIEPGSAAKLESYLKEAEVKYEIGMKDMVYKPGLSFSEFLNWSTIKGALKLDVFTSMHKHIRRYFKNPRLIQLMEFPILFLGALPRDTPALYSLMNYADIKGGTWYPEGGMYAVVKGMYKLGLELGVNFYFNEEVRQVTTEGKLARGVKTGKGIYEADAVISAADYHFTETKLLEPAQQSYDASYWSKKIMAPSCLMYYVGLNKKLKHIEHHSLFFDVPFEQHGQEIYKKPGWPTEPLFYASVSSLSDEESAPAGHESMVLLVPVAAGLRGDTEELREKYFQMIMQRMEKHTGQAILDSVIYKKTFSVSDFTREYHSFRGNAYGLANTLMQTSIFRPSCRSKKLDNLFYTGQLTVPGPGVPPCLISGEIVAKLVHRLIA